MALIAIDNGTTGTIAVYNDEGYHFFKTPIKKEQSYTKKKQNISRIDHIALFDLLDTYYDSNTFVVLERPLVNPGLFKATLSAVRALESTLCVIETLGIGVQYIDSKEWQKVMLPEGTKGSAELKKASKDIGCRLFPQHKELIIKHKDADALLILEYWKRNKL